MTKVVQLTNNNDIKYVWLKKLPISLSYIIVLYHKYLLSSLEGVKLTVCLHLQKTVPTVLYLIIVLKKHDTETIIRKVRADHIMTYHFYL